MNNLIGAITISTLSSLAQPGTGQPAMRQTSSRSTYLVASEPFPGIAIAFPTDISLRPGDTSRIYVSEQRASRIIWFDNVDGASQKITFFDISDRVEFAGVEAGLLGFAFHPDYPSIGSVFVSYATVVKGGWTNRVSRFEMEIGPLGGDRLDPDSEVVLIEIFQNGADHYIHRLRFGPDGYLYICAGDGGSVGQDAEGDAQNPGTLKGSILRIDIDNTEPPLNYAIPPSNPFVDSGMGFREEVFAYGVRNPWRMAFGPDGRIWIGDVGSSQREEISWVTPGANLGWNFIEGTLCRVSPECLQDSLIPPVFEYMHEFDENGGFAITAGEVLVGPSCGDLEGQFIFSDFVTGNIWALEHKGDQFIGVTNLIPLSGYHPTAFTTESDGRLLMTDFAFSGKIIRLECVFECVADFGAPFGTLDFSDVVAFLTAFAVMDSGADLAPPFGTLDFSDVIAFLSAFAIGCP